jgi:hypothetical protein
VVRFEWDEEKGEYRRSFEEGGTGDDAHLLALEPEADFLAFLPAGAVEVDEPRGTSTPPPSAAPSRRAATYASCRAPWAMSPT